MCLLSAYSPHLQGKLKRKVDTNVFTKSDLQLVDSAFEFSLGFGGERELDFNRAPGVSFNPRPARIALILLNDAGLNDASTVAAAIVATAFDVVDSRYVARNAFPADVCHLAEMSTLNPGFLRSRIEGDISRGSNSDDVQENRAAGLICLSHRLDRCRHLHLMENTSERWVLQLWQEFLAEQREYIALAALISEPLREILQHWERRFSRRLEKISTMAQKRQPISARRVAGRVLGAYGSQELHSSAIQGAVGNSISESAGSLAL